MRHLSLLTVLLFLLMCGRVAGGEFFSNFDFGSPAGTQVYGDATINPVGGVDDSGVLRLTPAEQNRSGTFIIPNLDTTRKVAGFVLRFKTCIRGGYRGADGMSVSYGTRLSPVLNESGNGSGLVVAFNTYIAEGKGSPVIRVKLNGRVLATQEVPRMRTKNFVGVEIRCDTNRVVNVMFDGERVLADVPVPELSPVAGGQFGFGARTGAVVDNHFVDDIYLVTATEGRGLPGEEELAAGQQRRASFHAERFFFLSDGAVLQGCFYKPEGNGPFPVVVFNPRQSVPLVDRGVINPLPRLGEFFTANKYVLCMPIEPVPEEVTGSSAEQEQALVQRSESAAMHIQSAIVWLTTQSFVDAQRIFLMGDGTGANAALSAASANKEVRGTILFSPDADRWSAYPNLQARYVRALTEASAPVLLLQPANIDSIDAFFALRTVIEAKGKPNDSRLCQPYSQGRNAFNFAVEGIDGWKKDVFDFIHNAFAGKQE